MLKPSNFENSNFLKHYILKYPLRKFLKFITTLHLDHHFTLGLVSKWMLNLKLFSSIAKVVVITGFHEKNGQKTEVIDLVNPSLKCNLLADVPARAGSVGGLLKNQPLICGGARVGDYYQDCIFIGQPKKKIKMLEKRVFASR